MACRSPNGGRRDRRVVPVASRSRVTAAIARSKAPSGLATARIMRAGPPRILGLKLWCSGDSSASQTFRHGDEAMLA
jgi:hypothetical protein